MRILHVGSGFRPWVVNGLVIYAEELMAGQVARGHQVGYFFAGRHYPLMRQPRLHRWSRRGVAMYEWMSSPLVVGALSGIPDPEAELANAPAEEAFRGAVAEFAPQLVHVHDFGGLPSSVLGVPREAGLPVVMTLNDYFALCPTVRLYDVEGNICLRIAPGAECARCCAEAPRDNFALRDRTIGFEGIRARKLIPGLASALARPVAARSIARVGRAIATLSAGPPRDAPSPDEAASASPEAYQRRRDVNLERLNALDALLAPSDRTAEIYRTLGVRAEKLRRIDYAASHLERLHVTHAPGTAHPLTFATLGSLTSRQKGADVILGALRILDDEGLAERYRLLVGGWVPPEAARELAQHAAVTIHGLYQSEDLDALLHGVDVGIVPSVWEEVSGLVGLEFLAKGIPVIANALGGMVAYVRDGETGWLNHSNDAAGLAAVMAAIIRLPEEVQKLSRSVIGRRAELIEPLGAHVEKMDGIYDEVLERSPAAARERSARRPVLW
jgi:glycosyltransferase involved in cell wall biosynthesis